MDDALARAEALVRAGVECLFVTGVVDLDVLGSLVKEAALPINAMAGPERRALPT